MTDPAIIGLTPETRSAQLWSTTRRRVAVLERAGGPGSSGGASVADATTTVKGKVQLAGHLAGTAAAPELNTTAAPQVARLGLGVAAGATDALKLQTAAMTNRVVDDTAHGADVLHFGSIGEPGQRWQIEHGTSGAPVTTDGATLKVSRSESYTPSVVQGAEFVHYSAILGHNLAIGDSAAQPVGVTGVARTGSTVVPNGSTLNPDACGVIGHGSVISGGNGVAMGAHMEAHTASTTGYAKAIELQARNASGTPATLSTTTLSQSCGAWVVLNGNNGGGGIEFGNPFGYKWSAGISFKSANGGPINTTTGASIQDDGSGAYSYLVNGTHAEAAIAIGASAGKFLCGLTTSASSAKAIMKSDATGNNALIARAFTGQTAPIFAVEDSAAATLVVVSAAGRLLFGSSSDTNLYRASANLLATDDTFQAAQVWTSGTGGQGFMELLEQTSAPASPPSADRVRIYAEDGAGSDSVVKFVDNTGVVGRVAVVKGAGSPIWGMWGLNSSFTTSTDKTATINNLYVGAVHIGNPCSLTGIEYAVGTVVSGNVIANVFDATGVWVASTTSTAQAGASGAFQQLAFASALKLRAMGTYYIGLQFSSATARFWAIAHPVFRTATGEITGRTYGEATSITPPSTYTASIAPLIRTY